MNNRMTFRIWLIAFFVIATVNLRAQDGTKKLSLQEAINIGIQNSKNLKISKAKIDEATALLQQANDSRLPDFNINGSYLRLNSANIKLVSDSSRGGAGIKINQALYGTATLSLPLYAGGRIKYGIESARFLKQASVLDAENDKEAVIFNTIKAFINLYKSYEAVLLVKENLQSSVSRDRNFSNLEKNGLLARNDFLKSQLQTSNIELSLLDAQTNNKLAMVNMNLMLGLPENTLLLLDTGFMTSKQYLKNFEEYENQALERRKDLQALNFRKKAAVTAIRSANAEAYPVIGLTGGYVAAYVPDFITVTNALNVGIGVKYNLANLYKKNSNLMQANARQTELNANEEILNDAIKSQVNQDYQNYLLNQKKMEVYESAFEQAKENYRITKNKYDNSLVTITDLLEADVALLQSKLNISFAKADAVLAYNKLLQTSGTLSQ
ncbi:MAG: TolC family protein [Ferruginibacter sp.]|nr:TolC family protein [Ferruginibacter sp.]